MFDINGRVLKESAGAKLIRAIKESAGSESDQISEESLPEAIALLDAVIESDPSNVKALANRGLLRYLLHGDLLALEDLDRAIGLSPNTPQVYGSRAWFRLEVGDFHGAVEDSTQAIELDSGEDFPTLCENYLIRAWSLYYLGKMERAFMDINYYIEWESSPAATAYKLRGRIHMGFDELLGAELNLDMSIRLDGTDPQTYEMRGEIRRARSDYAGAMEDLDTALLLDPRSSAALISRGAVHRETGEYTKALEDLNKALKIESEKGECRDRYLEYNALEARGRLRVDTGDYPSAIRDFDAAIQLEDVETSCTKKAFSRLYRGDCLDLLGDSAGAIASYMEAAEIDPENGNCPNRIGETLMCEGRFTEALPFLEKANEMFKAIHDKTALGFYWGLLLCYHRTGNPDKGMALATQVINEEREGCLELGMIYEARALLSDEKKITPGVASQFESDVLKATELGVTSPHLLFWAGEICVVKGNWEKAKKMYKKLWAVSPSDFIKTCNRYKAVKGTPGRLLKLLKKIMEESKNKDVKMGLSTNKNKGDKGSLTGKEELTMKLEFQSEDDLLYSFRRSSLP